MSNLSVNTTQNVNLDYKIVGLGERIVAFLIDGFVLYMYIILVNAITSAMGLVFDDDWTVFGLRALIFLPAMFYTLICHILFQGRTLGKYIMKMRVVKIDGSPVHWSSYIVRWMLRLVDIWLFLGAVGILSILFSDKKQRLGDAASGTVVISTKQKTKITHTILEEVKDDYTPVFVNVTQLEDKDIRLIKETFLIAKQTADYKTMKQLRLKVESILGTNSGLYDREFIDTVLKDYNYYTQNM
ncbi:RDD family protein [Abyssalbus ytuae]|uniref:RDD family protein n=1 Tax=Abyssalbus ytuae TaxID=2926907 RepID=A0A9E7D3N3_9FLAO|nr:RDD family protein [Abyssalbus ytuae]UOB18039.1 RDD family protein [Abyssalbus ytuae]